MDTIGSRVYKLRKMNKLTQADLGKIVGLHSSNVSRIEHDLVIPDGEVVLKMAERFGVTCDFILGKTMDISQTPTDFIVNPEDAGEGNKGFNPDHAIDMQMLEFIPLFRQLSEDNRVELFEYAKMKLKLQKKAIKAAKAEK